MGLPASNFASHVYVAVDANGWHKIGITAAPKIRAYHLARDRRMPVEILKLFPPRKDAHRVEVTAHWLLSEYENGREWFNVDRATALSAVEDAYAKVDAGHIPHSRFSYERRKVKSAEQDARVRDALFPGETMKRFFDEAVERELERRGKDAR